MDLNRLSAKQQWALLLVLLVLLATPYAIKRFWPAYQTLMQNQQKLQINQNTVKNPDLPEMPSVDEEDVQADIEAMQQRLDGLISQTDTLQSRIAPPESQDVLLELSAAARVNNITILENVPYIVQRVAESVAAKKTSGTTAPARRMDKADRRALRAANRRAAATQTSSGKSMIGAIPREGELIYDVVNQLDEARPIQFMSLQGTYFGLMGFIEAIRNLPVQVTLLNINIDTQVQISSQRQQNMQGLPQLIRVSLIVAL